mmetsp:Transcript_60047/g.166214  ORF Transcript_60047/g.166214 Transcript_60047/m.166214 type:complete len:448 (-) Transcript_60047:181-1524(-)
MGLAPQLCVLFLATRLRALQITQQRGAPPGWAQDFMLMCVFATCIQAVCCLVMPIFIGSACKVDEDGNPDYDLRPMIGAYAVTVVKYVSLMFLHVGAFAICCAVFSMTPETAHSGGHVVKSERSLYSALLTALCVFLLALLMGSAKVVGLAVKWAIESCDRVLLGVDITIGHAALGVCKGYVNIRDLVVHQPDDEMTYLRDESGQLVAMPTGKKLTWKESYILRVKKVIVKIDLWALITSLGQRFVLENLTFTGVHANIEKPSANLKLQDSNVEYIINHMTMLGLIEDGAEDVKDMHAKAEEATPTEQEQKAREQGAPKKKQRFEPRVALHKVALGDMGCGVVVDHVPIIGTIRFHPSIGKISFEDAQEELFGGREDSTPTQVIVGLVRAVIKKLSQAVVVDIPRHLAKSSADAAKEVSGACMQRLRSTGRTIAGAFQRRVLNAGCS